MANLIAKYRSPGNSRIECGLAYRSLICHYSYDSKRCQGIINRTECDHLYPAAGLPEGERESELAVLTVHPH